MRIEKLQDNFDVKIKWVHFPLHPDTPMEGRTMEELFAGRNIDLKANYETMKARMDAEGLEYGQRTHSYNSRLAQELGKWADTQPGGEAIHNALYRAYFIDNNNLADIDVLVAVAESVGLPGDAARQVLESRSFEAEIDADWAKSREYGVTGVPTFVAGGYGVVGAQPYEALEGLMKQVAADAEQNGDAG